MNAHTPLDHRTTEGAQAPFYLPQKDEVAVFEAAAALRREAEDLVEQDLATSVDAVEEQAQLVEALHDAPQRRDLAWRLGLEPQVTEPERRSVEIRNFIEHLVLPTRSGRGRG